MVMNKGVNGQGEGEANKNTHSLGGKNVSTVNKMTNSNSRPVNTNYSLTQPVYYIHPSPITRPKSGGGESYNVSAFLSIWAHHSVFLSNNSEYICRSQF